MSELRQDAHLLHTCAHPSAPSIPDDSPILGTFGVWVQEIGDCDLATVRTPDGRITVMKTEDAKRLYAEG